MCGIIGILSEKEVAPVLVEGLKRLEYRGYDSAGIATLNGGQLARRRALGKLVNLSDLLVHEPLAAKAVIGHTRWATHAAPSVVNAHPHMAGQVAVVHNGIIENFRELRAELAERGRQFSTETDTETVALLAAGADVEHTPADGLWPLLAAAREICPEAAPEMIDALAEGASATPGAENGAQEYFDPYANCPVGQGGYPIVTEDCVSRY